MSSHTAQTELEVDRKVDSRRRPRRARPGSISERAKARWKSAGADNPVVKDAFGLPYIPGSSLRGKLRSLLEQSSGLAVPARACLFIQAQRPGSSNSSERPSR